MKIISSAFQEGKAIPTKYAYHGVVGGNNISLPLSWSELPPAAKSLALSIVDPHPVAKNWVHWFVINLPKNSTGLNEGISGKRMPPGAKELYNSYGTIGYGGPEPPKGTGPHPYVVTLYALSVDALDLPENTTLPAFTKALEGKIIAATHITGIYER